MELVLGAIAFNVVAGLIGRRHGRAHSIAALGSAIFLLGAFLVVEGVI